MNWYHLKEKISYSAMERKGEKNQTNLRCLTFPEKFFFPAKCIRTEMRLFSYACNIRLSNFIFDLIVGEMIRKLITKLMNNLMACSG